MHGAVYMFPMESTVGDLVASPFAPRLLLIIVASLIVSSLSFLDSLSCRIVTTKVATAIMSSADHPPHPLAQSPTQLIVPSPSRGSGTIHDTQLPSPSPKKPPPSSSTADSSTHSNNNLLGLGLPTTVAAPSVLAAYPHLGHYIYNLLSAAASPPRATTLAAAPSHHPLSVSSSGESSASDEDESGGDKDDEEVRQKTPKKQTTDGAQGVNKDALVKQIVRLLDDEEEEEVKDLLRPHMGDSGKVRLSRVYCVTSGSRKAGRYTHGPGLPGLYASAKR